MIKIGIFGCRGIVGKTIIERILIKRDYKKYKFLSLDKNEKKLKISKINIIISCKSEKFSKNLIKIIRIKKWKGYFLDLSSNLRSKKLIVLDPINKKEIINNILKGEKFFAGGNCTVSLMLMSILGILKEKIKKIYCSTYQSISGAGYKFFLRFLKETREILKKKKLNLLKKNKIFKNSVCFSLLPWIDKDIKNGDSKEEFKGNFESNKILKKKIKVYSTCVRVGVIRCHSQSLIIKLKKNISLKNFTKKIKKNKYLKFIENKKKQTINYLNPTVIAGSDKLYLGRLRKICKKEFSFFIVGDQLLWGAVEPIRRMLKIIKKHGIFD